jgi:hypothetical protein
MLHLLQGRFQAQKSRGAGYPVRITGPAFPVAWRD